MRDRMMTGRMIINEKYDNRYGFYVKVDNILILYLLKKYQYFYHKRSMLFLSHMNATL